MQRGEFCRYACVAFLAFLTGCGIENVLPDEDGQNKIQQPADTQSLLQKARFFDRLDGGKVQCRICFKNCIISSGETGFCHNRKNEEGNLYNLVYGRPSAVQFDPVEKEPLHHFLPGTDILCIGTAGCNFRCKFCHNWHLSQQSIEQIGFYQEFAPDALVQKSLDRWRPPSISFTYNEPTVIYEYVYDTAKLARKAGLKVVIHSNGSMNAEPLRPLLQHVDAATVDLKAFHEDFYRDVSGGQLEHVLGTLKIIREEGVWLELVNLVIPGLNDDPEDLKRMCAWICHNLGPETPLHFSRFFPAYRLTDLPPTPVETLEQAHQIAQEEGLLFVSIGNVPGHTHNSTFCHGCGDTIIKRVHFTVHSVNMEEGRCSSCGVSIPGVWQ